MCGLHSGILSVGIRGVGNIFFRSAPVRCSTARAYATWWTPPRTSRYPVSAGVAELRGGEVRHEVVERARLLTRTEVERLVRVVHEGRHLAEAAAEQLLHCGGAGGIRVRRRRELDREPVDPENHQAHLSSETV